MARLLGAGRFGPEWQAEGAMRGLAWMAIVAALAAGCGHRAPRLPEPVPAAAPGAVQRADALVTYPEFGDADPHRWTGRAPPSIT